jgi:sulfur-carrier protein
MQITVKLYASLRWKQFDEAVWQCRPEALVAEVVDELQIPRIEVGIVLINGLHSGWDEVLQEGDVLSLLPRMGGG